MSILIEITGSLIEEEIFKQLNRFGWSQIIENGKTYYALFKSIMINGKSKDVEAFRWEYTYAPLKMVFQSCVLPKGVTTRTGNTVLRVLAGKITSDLISNDCLNIKMYRISFQ